MADTPFTSQRGSSSKGSRSKRRPARVRLEVEVLEGRVVPSYFPTTTVGIHVFEDQLPAGLSTAMVRFLATHTDGTQKQTSSEINQFRAINPDYTLLHYQLGTGNSAYDYIINNLWSSDWSYVNGQENWFAHQSYSGEPQSPADLSSGRVLGNRGTWDQADIANPAWQKYTLDQVFQNMAATGSTGWFADSFTYGIGGAGYSGPVPTRYQRTNAANPADWPGGVTWTTQLGNWAQTIETAFAQHNATYGTDYKFIPNLDARVTSWEPNWYDNSKGVPIVDGAFLEGFGQYTDTYDWKLSMNRGLNLTDNGKIVIMQPYLTDTPDSVTGQRERNFYLGTYLLLKGNETYLNMFSSGGGGAQYFPEYQLNLGAATTPPASNVSSYLWNGVYRRDFQNGFVLVNPGTTTYTLSLGGNYREVQSHGGGTLSDSQLDAKGNYIGGSLTYANVNSVTLTGGSAAVFLDTATPPAAPTNFKATAGNAQVVLTWTASSGATSYNLYRSTASGAEAFYKNVTGTSFTDTGLANGTTYYYQINAVNAGGSSARSGQVSAKPAAPTLPAGWLDADIGSPGQTGSASYSSGTFTVNGGGSDIGNTSDQFNYAYQSLTGNGTIVAKVNSQQNTSTWAKAGVMIRDGTAANGAYAFVFTTPGNGVDFQFRTADGGFTQWRGHLAAAAPEWVKLVRSGSTFTGYASSDGVVWTELGSTTISMGSMVDAGLAVTADKNGALSTATFSNVTVRAG
jgi:Hypothetical glycosyl hydrolase family 15/Fibronectin type III domain